MPITVLLFEVEGEVGNVVLFGEALADFIYPLSIFVRTDREGSGEGIEIVGDGVLGGFS